MSDSAGRASALGAARVAMLVVMLVGMACATAVPYQGDRLFDEGRFVAAEAAYRDYLTSAGSGGVAEARALYRLGFLHSLEGGALHDTRKAKRYFSMLEDRYPSSPYALQARLFVRLTRDTERLRIESAEANLRISGLVAELESRRAEATRSQAETASDAREVDLLETALDQLREEVQRLRGDLAERERELESLKAIDLGIPPV